MDTRQPEHDFEPDANDLDDIARRIREISNENDRLFRRLLEGEEHFRRLAKAVWKVQEEERRRLALELHDGIGQTLTALKNYLQQQRKTTADPDARKGFSEAFDLAAGALQDTRELSRILRPPVLDDLGLRAALEWLARINRERAGLDVRIDWQAGEESLPDSEVETLVFRAVQEALNNVVKHAGTDHATVSVKWRGEQLAVSITDEGKGFDAARIHDRDSDGFGLRGLCDRVELFGGRVQIDSSERGGTRIAFSLPLPPGEGGR